MRHSAGIAAKTYSAWWANKRSSQPHAKAWLDASRRALPDFRARHTVFVIDEAVRSPNAQDTPEADEGHQVLEEYVESTISLERDLEGHLVNHLESLEPGLSLVSRQEVTEVGRIDILARDREGRTVIVELKAGEARDSAIGQVARYLGWYTRRESVPPRAILVAGSFAEPVRYAAAAIPGLRLVTYRVSFAFSDAVL